MSHVKIRDTVEAAIRRVKIAKPRDDTRFATPSRHVSIQNLKREPPELVVQAPTFADTDPGDLQGAELINRLFELTKEDPSNYVILCARVCRRMTFPEIAAEPVMVRAGLDADAIRKRFDRLFGHLVE